MKALKKLFLGIISRKYQGKKDKIYHNDAAFWSVLILIVFIPLIALCLSVSDYLFNAFNLNYIKSFNAFFICIDGVSLRLIANVDFINSLGVALQVVCAIVCSVISILNISISLLNNDFLGIKIKSIYEMRKKECFSVKWSTIILIVLLTISTAGYVSNRIFLCIAVSLISLIYCGFLMFTEFPLLMLRNKAIFKIIDDRFIDEYNGKARQDDYIANDFSQLVFAIINDSGKGLSWVYGKLNHNGKKIYNKFLLERLLEIQTDKAFELAQIESKKELIHLTNKLLESACDIIDGSFDIIGILGENTNEYKHYATRILYQLLLNETSKEKAENRISDLIKWNVYNSLENSAKEQLCFSVITALIVELIKDNDFSLIKRVKISLSAFDYSLQNNSITSRIFLMISFIMYYLAEIEDSVPLNIKENIRSFIADSGIEDNTEVRSWKQLFEEFNYNLPITLNVFLSDFNQNDNQYAFYLYSNHANTVVLTEQLALKWYLANFFNSQNIFSKVDYGQMFLGIRSINYYLKEIERDNYNQENGEFVPSDEFKKHASFYSNTPVNFDLFSTLENRNRNFKKYIQSIRREELETVISESAAVTNSDLALTIKTKIEDKIHSLFGYDQTIDLGNNRMLNVSLLGDRKSRAFNHYEAIVNCGIRQFIVDVRKKEIDGNHNVIQAGSEFENKVDELANSDFAYITSDIDYIGKCIKDLNVANHFAEKIKNAQVIDRSNMFFGMPTILLLDGFKFNCSIDFKVEDLSPDQISQYVDNYKRPDGKYVYEDTYLTREELSRIIMKTKVIYKTEFKYKVKTYKGGINIIDMYPEIHRKS